MSRFLRIAALISLMLVVTAPVSPTWAQDAAPANPPAAASDTAAPTPSNQVWLGNPDIYKDSAVALTMLFVLAVLLENAFSVIFNWRVFLTYFSLGGVKTIIMIAISYALVVGCKIDIVASLIKTYTNHAPLGSFPTSFVTALILAGGSAGVYNIMRALGYRSGEREEIVNPRPPKDKAWVAVRATRKDSKGEIFVTVRKIGPADDKSPAPIAGMIQMRRPSIIELLLRNRNRFPQNGGYTVAPKTVYEIAVESKDGEGHPIKRLGEEYVFAEGAIVDFDVTL
jgi:hypothetical protein